MKSRIGIGVLGACILLMLALPALAENDPPSRVMRLKYISGSVSFQPGGVDDWAAASINRPLTTADRVWTDKNSKAELTLASAALRMDSETSLTLTNVSDSTVQVELDQGVLNLHVRRLYPGEIYEVDTPNMAFTVTKAGDYRFEVNTTSDTTYVIVRKGRGEANGDGRGVEVSSGQMARFEHGNTLMHTIERAPGLDGFDDWCQVREQRERGAESVQYVSSDVIGYEDLDDYGYWRVVPTYGAIWVPRGVAAGWAPYRYGHWVWVSPWGWTWVDDAPWGFAPFHYGRWVYSSYGWGWCPGPRHYRPVYAPAMVAWFGGGGWGVSLSFGSGWGWVPLGWGEPYYPYYHVSHRYVRNVNISNTYINNITYVTNNYRDRDRWRDGHGRPPMRFMNEKHGMTGASDDAMRHSRPIGRDGWRIDSKDVRGAHVVNRPELTPAKWTALGGDRRPAMEPPRQAFDRKVVSKLRPPDRPTPSFARDNEPGMRPNAPDRNARAERPTTPEPNRGQSAESPRRVVPRPPAERGRLNGDDVANRQPAVENGRRAVPRPPTADRQLADNSSERNSPAAAAESPRRVVPRPPADRMREDQPQRSPANDVRAVPRPPEDRRPSSDNGEGRRQQFDPSSDRPMSAAPSRGERNGQVERAPDRNAPERRAAPNRERPSRDEVRETPAQRGAPQSRMFAEPSSRDFEVGPSRSFASQERSYRTSPAYESRSMSRSEYSYRSAPTVRSTPSYRSGSSYGSAPSYRSAPSARGSGQSGARSSGGGATRSSGNSSHNRSH